MGLGSDSYSIGECRDEDVAGRGALAVGALTAVALSSIQVVLADHGDLGRHGSLHLGGTTCLTLLV